MLYLNRIILFALVVIALLLLLGPVVLTHSIHQIGISR